MKCPIDDRELVMSERQGIEIDYCPTCRGVWLDRGELDKIIERASADVSAGDAAAREDRREDRRARRTDGRDAPSTLGPKKKRKESFLADLFEFGG